MKSPLRIVGVVLVLLVGVVLIAIAAANALSDRKMQRKLSVTPAGVPYAGGEEVLARGKYLFDSRGCMECHGANGGGQIVIDDPRSGMFVRAPNITASGSVRVYTEVDWVRAIRHGIRPDGTPLMIMPSEDYNRLSDPDVAALVAYTRSLDPAHDQPAEIRLPLIVRAMYAAGMVKDAAEKIDHRLPAPAAIPSAVNVAHGSYVAQMCIGCHGAGLSGGRISGSPPDWPDASNLTPGEGSVMPVYADVTKFKQMLRTGKRPDGTAVSKVMPFTSLKELSDVDAEALYLYLKSAPARAVGQR